ncbi:type VI secretion system baseplate subunit TssK, partial [Enterobacter hormaechei]|nr:type VI secretion system baseplate subunit TssK [Enterobacter hormaechei]
NNCIAHLGLIHPWGVLDIRVDQEALRLNRLKVQHLKARLPDGTLIDTDHADNLPAVCDLQQVVSADMRAVEVLLALPLEHANGGNCRQSSESVG